jgi:hypothetical protein
MSNMRPGGLIEKSYLVNLVVELLVVLVQFGLLRVVPGRHELVKLDLLPPLLSVEEPRVPG